MVVIMMMMEGCDIEYNNNKSMHEPLGNTTLKTEYTITKDYSPRAAIQTFALTSCTFGKIMLCDVNDHPRLVLLRVGSKTLQIVKVFTCLLSKLHAYEIRAILTSFEQ